MSSRQLSNYLRANRKRLALSQEEVAFLLGTETGEKVCRHEMFTQEPGLMTALAYEAVFRRPVRELFGGLFQRIEREVAARAKTLVSKQDRRKPTQRNARRCQALADLASTLSKSPTNPS